MTCPTIIILHNETLSPSQTAVMGGTMLSSSAKKLWKRHEAPAAINRLLAEFLTQKLFAPRNEHSITHNNNKMTKPLS